MKVFKVISVNTATNEIEIAIANLIPFVMKSLHNTLFQQDRS